MCVSGNLKYFREKNTLKNTSSGIFLFVFSGKYNCTFLERKYMYTFFNVNENFPENLKTNKIIKIQNTIFSSPHKLSLPLPNIGVKTFPDSIKSYNQNSDDSGILTADSINSTDKFQQPKNNLIDEQKRIIYLS